MRASTGNGSVTLLCSGSLGQRFADRLGPALAANGVTYRSDYTDDLTPSLTIQQHTYKEWRRIKRLVREIRATLDYVRCRCGHTKPEHPRIPRGTHPLYKCIESCTCNGYREAYNTPEEN